MNVGKARKRKLSVWADEATMKRLGREKVDTGLTIEEIVNRRIALSYKTHPENLSVPSEPSPAA